MNLGLVFQQGDPVLIGVFLFLISMSICTWCVIVLRSIRHVAAKKANAAASEAIWSSKTLAGAETEHVVEFMSVAGLPARGVRTKFLDSYIKRESKLQANAKADPRRCTQGLNCLTSCGLRDGLAKAGQFCIDIQLSAAFRGEVDKGLFFRGKDPLPFGNAIRTVQETIQYLLNGALPAAAK